MMKGFVNSFLQRQSLWESPFAILSVRHKHSSTQTKRLFNKHPARLRLNKKLGVDGTADSFPTPQFPANVHTPRFLPNGWSAPPSTAVPSYPFSVSRTQNKPQDAVGFLPVYTKHRYVGLRTTKDIKLRRLTSQISCFVDSKDGTKVTTRIKQISGDRDLFLQELRATLQLSEQSIRVRTGGTVEVNGNYARPVRQWLAGLGF